MKHSIIILSTLILSVAFSSCLFSPSIKGDGNVVKEIRNVKDFDEIKVSRGMNVYISQGDHTKIIVKADQNLLDEIETSVDGNMLIVKAHSNIKQAKSKKVFVTTPNINAVKAIAGSNVYSETSIESKKLEIAASAGSNIKLEVDAGQIETSASAGSNIKLEGKSKLLEAKASAGSNIKSELLKTEEAEVIVSSGSNIWTSVDESLKATASSGGNIFYKGNPSQTEFHKSSGGNVIKE